MPTIRVNWSDNTRELVANLTSGLRGIGTITAEVTKATDTVKKLKTLTIENADKPSFVTALGYELDKAVPKMIALQAELKAATKELENAIAPAKQMGVSLQEFATSASQIGRTLTASVTLPIVAAGVAAVKFASDFEADMVKVSTLSGVTEADMQSMKTAILELAPAVGIGPDALAKAMLVVTSTGTRGKEALDILTIAAKASAVGMGDATDIARTLTSIIKAYGSENITAAHAAEVMFKIVKDGNADANELAGSLGRVIGIASTFGISLEDIGTFVASFTKIGVSTAEAVTAVRGIIGALELKKPTADAIAALESVGLSFDKLRENIKTIGFTDAMQDLFARFKGHEGDLQPIVSNIRAMAGAMGTYGAQAKDVDLIQQHMKETTDEFGAAFQRTGETTAAQMAQLKAQIEVLAVVVGEQLLPHLKTLVKDYLIPGAKHLEDWAKAWKELPEPVKEFGTSIVLLTAAGGPVLLGLGSLAKSIIAIRALMFGASAVEATSVVGAAGKLATLGTLLSTGVFALGNTQMTREMTPGLDRTLFGTPAIPGAPGGSRQLPASLPAISTGAASISGVVPGTITAGFSAADFIPPTMAAQIAAAKKEIADLAAVTRVDLVSAIQAGGFSIKEMAEKASVSELAVELFKKQIEATAKTAKTAGADLAAFGKASAKLVSDIAGAQTAGLSIGTQLDEFGKSAQKLVLDARILGQVVPESIAKIAIAADKLDLAKSAEAGRKAIKAMFDEYIADQKKMADSSMQAIGKAILTETAARQGVLDIQKKALLSATEYQAYQLDQQFENEKKALRDSLGLTEDMIRDKVGLYETYNRTVEQMEAEHQARINAIDTTAEDERTHQMIDPLKKIKPAARDASDGIGDLAEAFGALAQISGGSFGGVIQEIGKLVGAINVAQKAMKAMGSSTTTTFANIAASASSYVTVALAFYQIAYAIGKSGREQLAREEARQVGITDLLDRYEELKKAGANLQVSPEDQAEIQKLWALLAQPGTPANLRETAKQLKIVNEVFDRIANQPAFLKAQGEAAIAAFNGIAAAVGHTKDEIEDLGIIAVGTFGAAIAAGATFGEAIRAAGPGLSSLQKAMKDLGIETDDVFLKNLLLQNRIQQENPQLIAGIDALGASFAALSQLGGVNEETFRAMERTGVRMYTRIQGEVAKTGGSTRDALIPMQGYLHDAEDAAIAMNIPLAESTANMIKDSKEAGIWQERKKTAIQLQTDAMDALIKKIGVLINTLLGIPDVEFDVTQNNRVNNDGAGAGGTGGGGTGAGSGAGTGGTGGGEANTGAGGGLGRVPGGSGGFVWWPDMPDEIGGRPIYAAEGGTVRSWGLEPWSMESLSGPRGVDRYPVWAQEGETFRTPRQEAALQGSASASGRDERPIVVENHNTLLLDGHVVAENFYARVKHDKRGIGTKMRKELAPV